MSLLSLSGDRWLLFEFTFTFRLEYFGARVKKSKRGACEQKAATVLPNRTAAT